MWHFAYVAMRVADERLIAKYTQFRKEMFGIAVVVGGLSAVVILLTPVAAYFGFKVANDLDTSYWTLRYLVMLLYIAMNAGMSIFPHSFNFIFFLSDAVLLSQLTSLYLYNEFSMTCLLNLLPIYFVLHNHLLVDGIQRVVKDEQKQKLTFVRLIGRHDAVFLFVIYTLFTVLFVLVDVFSRDFHFGMNFWYLGYATYAFARLMEHKNAQGKGLWIVSFLSVMVFIAVYLYAMKSYSVNPHPQRTFPLYILKVLNQTMTNETAAINVTETATVNVT
jgi:hypothetical protein